MARPERRKRDVELLLQYVDHLVRGKKADMEGQIIRCPLENRAELRLAMEGAALVEAVARHVRPLLTQRERQRALAKVNERLAL